MKRRRILLAIVLTGSFVLPSTAVAQQALPAGSLAIKVLVEKKVAALPVGRPRLYWRLENFPSLAHAQAAAGPMGLAAESAGRAWLFTLGPKGGSSAGGTKVAEIGPLPPVSAPEYLLRINEAGGPPGSTTAVHTHPGAEAFYVLTGELCQRTSHEDIRVSVGQGQPGHSTDTPMQITSCGSTDLREFAMFVVDATRPFSSPASFATGQGR